MHDARNQLLILTNIAVMAIFAMSYDLLLGYSGIISFGHVLFFGVGAYVTAIMMKNVAVSIPALLIALLLTLLITAFLGWLIGFFTGRLKSHFFAMFTLAIAELAAVLMEKAKGISGGSDGFSFPVPSFFRDKLTVAYAALISALVIFVLLRLFVNSPMGTTIIGIRENEARMRALGYPVLRYKVLAVLISGAVAGFAGMLYGVSMRFVSVPSVFGVNLTLDALLMTIVGGAGTLVGPVIGAVLVELVSQWLQLMAKSVPLLERWMLFFGLAYILVVLFFPSGILGGLQRLLTLWRKKAA